MKELDWKKYEDTSVKIVSEGIVLLKNDNSALPLDRNSVVSVFGRIQLHYYKSGTGSGGMVNVSKVTGIPDGLKECGIRLNEELFSIYEKWDEENPFDQGEGWGQEPWCQKEMPLDDETVLKASEMSDTALVIIGRTAGEEQDNKIAEGSWLLTEDEKKMLLLARKYFKKLVVVLNTGNIMDLTDIENIGADAVLLAWQGGMLGGRGTAEVLCGNVSPSGKLTDTIMYSAEDYPSFPYFGNTKFNCYTEDIYVGYRYSETFCPEKVKYPFGYGLSYTDFLIEACAEADSSYTVSVRVQITNTGKYKGKETVQLYLGLPQGKLGNPVKQLCSFEKTKELMPGERQEIDISFDLSDFMSFDDSGITGNKNCFVIEAGTVKVYCGNNVRDAKEVLSFEVSENSIGVKKCNEAMNPVRKFRRIRPEKTENGFKTAFEDVPVMTVNENERRLSELPEELTYTGNKGIKLDDVKSGKKSMDEFISQFSDYELSCIIRGEGMGSPKVTAGTASAFGGVTKELSEYGLPCACCSDGPSGLRMDSGAKAFSLPNGTLIASSFNKELILELFSYLGLEMQYNNIDCLLGPGMNIHRNPLNGRNFEYFSEDPYLTGTIASSILKGLKSSGVSGTVKHFCANNQELERHFSDSVVSARALREIYLKGFEIAVKNGNADSVMTTYGTVNGLYTAAYYDLTTTILRNEWGFDGIVMTDWWANINERNKELNRTNFAAMTRAQNDLYMVCRDSSQGDDNTLESLSNGSLTRGELQRNAANICRFLMNSSAFERMKNDTDTVTIINRENNNEQSGKDVPFFEMDDELVIDLSNVKVEKGSSYSFGLTLKKPGYINITLTASSKSGKLAQIPVTLFCVGTACGTFTFNGTNGENVSITKETPMYSRFNTLRLYFAQNGLTLHSVSFKYLRPTGAVSD